MVSSYVKYTVEVNNKNHEKIVLGRREVVKAGQTYIQKKEKCDIPLTKREIIRKKNKLKNG